MKKQHSIDELISLTQEEIALLKEKFTEISVNDAILDIIQEILKFTRESSLYITGLSTRAAITLLNTSKAWAVAIIISSFIFGFAHLYQGTSGIITTGFVSIIFGVIFYRNPKNLWVGIITHGIYDVFGITMIFLDKERVITNWALENIFFFI